MTNSSLNGEYIIDFELQNILTIRLEHPAKQDISAVENQLGLLPTPFASNGEPDIILKFREKIDTGPMSLLGLGSCGFDDDNFYILNVGRRNAKVIFPFEQVGGRISLSLESGLRHIPLLNHIINYRLIAKGFIPVHASAFLYKGRGILVPGWKTGGKTEALLSFVSQGAYYVGDEWVVLARDGKHMFGIPGPTSVKDWQFQYLKNLIPRIPGKYRLMFAVIHSLDKLDKKMQQSWLRSNFFIEILGDMLPSFKRQLRIWKLPRTLFKSQFCSGPVTFDKIFLILMHTEKSIVVQNSNADEIADRMVHTYDFEQKAFFEFYNAFKFAFPGKVNPFVETVKERENNLLHEALKDKPAFTVYRPYPVSFPQLFEKIRPYCQSTQSYSLAG